MGHFCLKSSDFMYFEPGWEEKRDVNSLPVLDSQSYGLIFFSMVGCNLVAFTVFP